MSGRRALGAVAGVVVLLLASCTGDATDADDGHGTDVDVCEAGFSTVAGFRLTESFRDPYDDHVGIRLGFVADDGREIHYFAGIPGEFGEGLPVVDTVEAAGGIDGTLQGEGSTWVLTWRAPGPCGIRAVLGTGFTRPAFLDTVEAAGMIPTGS